MSDRQEIAWGPKEVRDLTVRWSQKQSAKEISLALDRSRNAVLSKAKRLGLFDATIILLPSAVRSGQAAFRTSVLAVYGRCCVSGTSQPELLEAAHIVPYSLTPDHRVSNGLALRVDLHCLFDAGLMAISDDYRLVVSSKVADEAYTALQGIAIALPADREMQPSLAAIHWHRQHVFKG